MRRGIAFGGVSLLVAAAAGACSGTNGTGFQPDGGSGSGSGGSGSGSSSGGSGSGSSSGGILDTGDASILGNDGGEIVTTHTTIYANTDTALYSMQPGGTNPVALIGPFGGIDAGQDSVTDVAVNAEGDVYVNTETTIYKCALPSGGTGTVQLTNPTPIVYPASVTTAPRMYALAFAPPGLLGTGETLVGGDGNGDVWSIDPTTGNAINLGNFGADPTNSSNFLGLSGDIVFYTDSTGTPTGLATIRSCAPPPAKYPTDAPTCSKSSDFLAGINISELVNAYKTGTPSQSLNGGIYGAPTGQTSTQTGPGTGFGELFGLGAWEGNVYGFGNAMAGKDGGASTPPELASVSTSTGVGSLVSSAFGFTSGGWSGAGVTTKVTVTIIAPPPPPPIK
jgi:hypothetical protein